MAAHGPDVATYDKATNEALAPTRYKDTLAFMWESRFVFRPSKFALESPQLQAHYDSVWDGFRKPSI